MKIPAIAAAILALALAMACEVQPQSDRAVSEQVQQDVMQKANTGVPPYQPNFYPARETINRYLWEAEKQGEWYTYEKIPLLPPETNIAV